MVGERLRQGSAEQLRREGDTSFPITRDRVPVVVAPEEIDVTNAAALRKALVDAAAQGNGTLVVDMTRTRFCDSAGLNALARAHKQARTEGGELLLVVCATSVLRIFAITGIDHAIPVFPTLEAALARTPAG